MDIVALYDFHDSSGCQKRRVRALRFIDLDLVINGLSAMLCRKLKSLREDTFFMYDLLGKFQTIHGVLENLWKYILVKK